MFVLPVPRASQEAGRQDGPETVNEGRGGDERSCLISPTDRQMDGQVVGGGDGVGRQVDTILSSCDKCQE